MSRTLSSLTNYIIYCHSMYTPTSRMYTPTSQNMYTDIDYNFFLRFFFDSCVCLCLCACVRLYVCACVRVCVCVSVSLSASLCSPVLDVGARRHCHALERNKRHLPHTQYIYHIHTLYTYICVRCVCMHVYACVCFPVFDVWARRHRHYHQRHKQHIHHTQHIYYIHTFVCVRVCVCACVCLCLCQCLCVSRLAMLGIGDISMHMRAPNNIFIIRNIFIIYIHLCVRVCASQFSMFVLGDIVMHACVRCYLLREKQAHNQTQHKEPYKRQTQHIIKHNTKRPGMTMSQTQHIIKHNTKRPGMTMSPSPNMENCESHTTHTQQTHLRHT